MNDDWTRFMVVTAMLLMMIYLCVYVQNMALVQKDWVNLKCNPVYMLVNSITSDSKTAADNFKNCVNNV